MKFLDDLATFGLKGTGFIVLFVIISSIINILF